MFLDTWMKLGIYVPILLVALLLAALALGFTMYRAARRFVANRCEEQDQGSLLKVATVVMICILLAALVMHGFTDTRLERHLQLDLRKQQRALLTELRRCAGGFDDTCDSTKYSVTAEVILPEGQHLTIRSEYVHWSHVKGRLLIEIRDADANALSLKTAHDLLMRYAASATGQGDSESKEQIGHAQKWLLECCTGSRVYSKTLGIELTPHFGLQFYKNVDEVAITYLLQSA